MVATRYATGTGTTGAHMFIRAHTRKETNTDRAAGVLYMPGGNGTETTWQGGDATNPDEANLVLHRLARDSYSLRLVTMHTDWDWGNDTVVVRMFDALTHAFFNYGFSDTRVHLVGASMGGVCCLNFAKAHPTLVASVSIMLPPVDLDDIEANNRVGQYGLPNPSTAYGGSIPNDHNPIENAASFAGIPISMWGTTDDSICNYARAVAFAAAVGSNCTMNSLGPATPIGFALVGHDLTNLPVQDVVDFIIENDTAASGHKAPVIRRHTAGRGQ